MKKKVGHAVVSLLLCLSMLAFAGGCFAEEKLCQLGASESQQSLFEADNGEVYLLTTERLLRWSEKTGCVKVCDNDLALSLAAAYNGEIIAVSRDHHLYMRKENAWAEMGQVHFANSEEMQCYGGMMAAGATFVMYSFADAGPSSGDAPSITTVLWNMETKETQTFHDLLSTTWCVWDASQKAFLGQQKAAEEDREADWFLVAWRPGAAPERLMPFEYSSTEWAYGEGALYSTKDNGVAAVHSDGTTTTLPGLPFMTNLLYLRSGRLAGFLLDRTLCCYDIPANSAN